jgi:uncharacterized membrane protein YhaH (DUF805 family)
LAGGGKPLSGLTSRNRRIVGNEPSTAKAQASVHSRHSLDVRYCNDAADVIDRKNREIPDLFCVEIFLLPNPDGRFYRHESLIDLPIHIMWHYTIDNNPQDPCDEATIAQLVGNGTIHANTLVWCEGMADWMPIGSTELARYVVPVQAAPRPRQAAAPLAQARPHQALAPNPYAPPQTAHRPVQYAQPPVRTWSNILFSFEGRIPRRTYWAGIGIWIGIIMVTGLVVGLLAPLVGEYNAPFLSILFLVVMIPYLWSAIAMQIKRWHDRGKPGAMILVNLIPFVGGIWAFIECGCLRGDVGQNMYGQDPT